MTKRVITTAATTALRAGGGGCGGGEAQYCTGCTAAKACRAGPSATAVVGNGGCRIAMFQRDLADSFYDKGSEQWDPGGSSN